MTRGPRTMLAGGMRRGVTGLVALVAACARPPLVPAPEPGAAAPPPAAERPVPQPMAVDTPPARPPVPRNRLAPPQLASQLGLMPVASTGVGAWRLRQPSADGRGVLIAILDSGVDPGIAGLLVTSTGEPKLLDVRDFSGEGAIALRPVSVENGRMVVAEGVALTGEAVPFAAAAGPGTWYGGVIHEVAFGVVPEADLNDDGDHGDRFGVVVVRGRNGWVAIMDLNGDGSLADERPMADFLVARETFTFASRYVARGRGPITGALNLSEVDGTPRLALFLDTSGHGSHVAGIAAGNDIYGVSGFDGVAPGAQLLGLKIADNRRGGVSVTGSMLKAMEYAAQFARARNLPLVMNMSFGVGNAQPGRAVMDSIVNAFLLAHPDVLFTISAGNDGPGTETVGQPGSAALAFTVGATYPRSLAAVQFGTDAEALGWWSARGGSLARPDLVAPGLAYSTVPGWNTGDEIKGGTSMAAPHVAGLAALLLSASRAAGMAQPDAARLGQALRATARPFPGEPVLDQGAGLPDVEAAWTYLRTPREAPRFEVQALGAARELPAGLMPGGRSVAPAARVPLPSAAFRRNGLASPADTIQRFRVSLLPGVPARTRRYRLRSDAAWLRAAQPIAVVDSALGSVVIEARYDRAAVAGPGRHTGTLRAFAEGDSAAGPAFVLLNTVVVPEALPVTVRSKRMAGATTARWFVTVPAASSGFVVTARVGDTSQAAQVTLFEPTGRPARGVKAADLGGGSAAQATLVIAPGDMVSGVWEVVVQAMPGAGVTLDLSVRPFPARIVGVDSARSGAVRLAAGNDTALAVRLDDVGIVSDWSVRLGAGVWRRDLPVPDWARRLVVEVAMAPETWNAFTDFGITLFGPGGERIGNGAMNYPTHRVEAELPADRPDGYAAVLDLLAGFAHPAGDSADVRIRVRIEGEPRRLVGTPAARFRESAIGAVPGAAYPAPPGWRRLLGLHVGAADDDPAAMTWVFGVEPQ